MRTTISELPESVSTFQFFRDKQQKIKVAKDIIEKYSNDFEIFFNYDSLESRMIMTEQIILMESMILNINVFFDIIIIILKVECKKNIRSILNKSKNSVKLDEIEQGVMEYYNCSENKLVRNASNKMKHEGIVRFNHQLRNGISSCYLCPFSTSNYSLKNYISVAEIFSISLKLSRRFLKIVKLIKKQKAII